jgi:phosphatidate cytidylyltransferase
VTGQRVISALVIAAILLAAVFLLPAAWLVAVLCVVLLAAAWEWSALAGARVALRLLFMAVVAGLCALLWFASATRTGLLACLVAGLVFWSLALLWLVFIPHRQSTVPVFIAGVIAISVAWMALARMALFVPHGNLWVLYALLVVWVADSGAYFAGRRWGMAKLASRISPGKTWAGLWGGLLASGLLSLVAAFACRLPVAQLLLLTVVVAGYSVIGDLTESLCKRFAGTKDSGTLIPGHGGVLDRFDSLLAASPCLLLGMLVIRELQR